jgi:hypothetical protein
MVLMFLFITLVFFFFLGILVGAPWQPTSMSVVRKMLSMADTKHGDIVYDLGSGDGRIIVMAAREFNATSLGIEISPLLVFLTKVKVTIYQLSGKVNVVWGNFFNHDLNKADIVTLFLLQDTNQKLQIKLEKELEPGTRVVSHIFTFKDWKPLKVDSEAKIYLYRMP